MPVRQGKYLAGVMTVAALGAGFATAPAAHAERSVRVVHEGQSIQAAVDASAAGDTVFVMPGTYRESVQIDRKLTLRGAGAGQVTIEPAATSATASATKAADSAAACATAGHGICVTGTADHPVSQVRIESLTVEGFRQNGIDASGTDRMVVRHVLVKDNGEQGISQEMSTRAVLSANQAVHNGQSGIFVANLVDAEGGALDTMGTVISDNTLTGNRIGVTARRVRALEVENNTITGNCGGVFVVGDENTPHAGDLDIRQNEIIANNAYCASNGRLPFIQGTGVLLTGAEDTRVTDNLIRDNVGTSPMSGGVVLFPSTVGVANLHNQVTGNTLSGNGPADLAERDTAGSGNTFTGNTCQVSEPAGRC
ncbi:right-handed parallel beta-helix repeat-containing protein [Streptomyces sp.]|uniref:right-handed parallel beta-helix repeat-containing protein n=1 Tax=Streptomyces sp. TaxID=1931 RepID=UPI002F42988B